MVFNHEAWKICHMLSSHSKMKQQFIVISCNSHTPLSPILLATRGLQDVPAEMWEDMVKVLFRGDVTQQHTTLSVFSGVRETNVVFLNSMDSMV